jgi:hypothetical protein
MSELSNALRQRLAAREDPRVHPDPDSLTAYLEQLLSPLERDRVVEHLAVCRQCRDVVALSTPEPAIEAVPAVALPVRRGWRTWILGKPALGLAASLGALAIVATLVIELPRGSVQKAVNQPAPFNSASTNVPAASSAPAGLDDKQPALTPPAGATSTLREAETRVASAVKVPPPLPAEASVTATRVVPAASDSSVGGPYVNTQMFANDASNTITSQNELPAAPAPHSGVDRQNTLPLTENDQLSRADAPYEMHSSKPLRILSPAASASHFGLSMVTTLGHDAKQIFHKPAPPLYAYGFVNHAMGGAGQFNPAKETGPSTEVTAAAPVVGGRDAAELEQSHALTSRARSVAGADRVSGAMANAEMAKKAEPAPSAWKVGDSKLLKLDDSGAWTEGYSAGEGIEFSVVSTHGSDVWAGGSNAALVHSRDGGITWERITLGSTANGTITSIEAGALKIQVKSSSGQSWSSPDGGKTWVLQD